MYVCPDGRILKAELRGWSGSLNIIVVVLLSEMLYKLDSCFWSQAINLLAVLTIRASLALFLTVMLPYQVTIFDDSVLSLPTHYEPF